MFAILLGLLGCYKNTMTTGAKAGNKQHTEDIMFLAWGLTPRETIDTTKMCPNGVAKIEEEMEIQGALLSCVTCGFLVPMHVTVTCAGGRAYNVNPSTGAVALVEEPWS